MGFLLPQTLAATVRAARGVDIHGDRYVDVALAVEGGAPLTARVPAAECPPDLAPGDAVVARVVMGVVTRVQRA